MEESCRQRQLKQQQFEGERQRVEHDQQYRQQEVQRRAHYYIRIYTTYYTVHPDYNS